MTIDPRPDPRPCSATEAVARARSMVGRGTYLLGTGDYRPVYAGAKLIDLPWTERDGHVGSDCAGLAICYAYKLQRHRLGFNQGPWATVEDDINCNSAIEDADNNRELFERVTAPAPGVLLTYPTIRLRNHPQPFIGHVSIVVSMSRCFVWDPEHPDYSMLDVVQCCGPNGHTPGVIQSDGSIWNHHDHLWPKPEHRTVMLRAIP
jgi:hypothetical protein